VEEGVMIGASEEARAQRPVTVDELLRLVHREAKKVDTSRIAYAFMMMKIRRTRPLVEVARYCLALRELGLPISAPLLSELLRKDHATILNRLHNLGDKHVLVLKRKSRSLFEWEVSPVFLKYYKGWSP
jgi:hypothetical protein